MATLNPPSTQTSEQPSQDEELGTEMTLLEHLGELRSRLVRASIALLITTAISFIFADRLVEILSIPIGGRQALEAIDVTENMGVFMRVSLISGMVLAMPVIVYQFIRFIVPGLTREERRYLWFVVPSASLLFLLGVAFAYFVMLPVAVPFLIGFLNIPTRPRPSTYFGFISRLMFWIGASFETPLILAFLARLGIITPQFLKQNRKYAIVIIALIAAAITPTVDPVNMLLVMAPLLILSEFGVFLSRLSYRKRQA
ncbi:MAG: twin-arginine translocase subunit TatC [Anaerolineales bacterium]